MQGSVCISIVDAWRSTILDHGVIVLGQAQWLKLQWGQMCFGLLNLYAFNHASSWFDFWLEIELAANYIDFFL